MSLHWRAQSFSGQVKGSHDEGHGVRAKLGVCKDVFQAVHSMDLRQLHFLLALVLLSWQTRNIMEVIQDLTE